MAIIRWALSLLVVGFLIFFGATKFTGAAHIFPLIEYRASGLGVPYAEFIYPWANYAVGALEVVAGAMALVPGARAIGAPLAVPLFAGAVAFHLSPLLGVETPVGFAPSTPASHIASGGPFTSADFSAETTSVLFLAAIGLLTLSIVNAVLSRR